MTEGGYDFANQSLSEVEKVVTRVLNRMETDLIAELNELGDLDSSTFTDAKKVIQKHLSDRIGNPTAKTAPSVRRGSTPWNGYVHDHYARKVAQLSSFPENQGTMPFSWLHSLSHPEISC